MKILLTIRNIYASLIIDTSQADDTMTVDFNTGDNAITGDFDIFYSRIEFLDFVVESIQQWVYRLWPEQCVLTGQHFQN